MRSEQYIGLNEWAHELSRGKQVVLYTDTIHREYPDGTKIVIGPNPVTGSDVIIERYSTLEGAFGGEYPLFKYILADGREFFEYLQATPWSSGPCYFLALRDSKGDPVKESLWTDEELGDA